MFTGLPLPLCHSFLPLCFLPILCFLGVFLTFPTLPVPSGDSQKLSTSFANFPEPV